MSRNKIWVIDDDRAMRWVLEKTFKDCLLYTSDAADE